MGLREPESMDELLYFTKRKIGNGKIMAWVYRAECTECHEDVMGKPINKKTGKTKIRAKEYECPNCGHTESKKEHEEARDLEAKYTCPHCGKEGEAKGPYKRKTYKGVKAYVLNCEHCDEKLPVTKKIKKVDV